MLVGREQNMVEKPGLGQPHAGLRLVSKDREKGRQTFHIKVIITEDIFKSLSRKLNSNCERLRSELALWESAATRYECQMRSAPAVNRTGPVGFRGTAM